MGASATRDERELRACRGESTRGTELDCVIVLIAVFPECTPMLTVCFEVDSVRG